VVQDHGHVLCRTSCRMSCLFQIRIAHRSASEPLFQTIIDPSTDRSDTLLVDAHTTTQPHIFKGISEPERMKGYSTAATIGTMDGTAYM
jgi:hypothetical protein